MARDKTPDLMGDLLSGKKASKPASQEDSPTAARPAEPALEAPKIKATYYLSEETALKLEEAQVRLRRLLEQRGQINKSSIVEAALQQALEELEAKGADSPLAKRLAE